MNEQPQTPIPQSSQDTAGPSQPPAPVQSSQESFAPHPQELPGPVELLGRAFNTTLQYLRAVFSLILLFAIMSILGSLFIIYGSITFFEENSRAIGSLFLFGYVSLIQAPWCYLALLHTFITKQDLSVLHSLQKTLRLVPSFLLLFLFSGTGILILLAMFILPRALLLASMLPLASPIVLLGLFILILSLILSLNLFTMSINILVSEQHGVIYSLKRAYSYLRGYWSGTAGRFLFVLLVTIIGNAGIATIVSLFALHEYTDAVSGVGQLILWAVLQPIIVAYFYHIFVSISTVNSQIG